jgi:TM2 domain-containing membrane protein YozV
MQPMINPDPMSAGSARTNLQSATTSSAKVGTCPLCGAPLHDSHACDRCDWVPGYGHFHMDSARQNPRDLFAAILSLFWPGTGHFYKGHTSLAAVLAALGVLCFLWSITFFMFFGFLCIPAYWGGVALHAYFLADLKHPVANRIQKPATA